MSVFKETISPEKKREMDRPATRETDIPRLPHSTDIKDNPFSDSSDVFNEAFKKLGLTADTSEKKASDTKDSSEHKDYSDYLEKGDDGKYYDKETGKAYDSIEAWEKAQETLAKRYESTAKYYEEKAKKEWARFKNAEENGESDSEKWEHYRRSQEYYTKAKECKEKAAHIREKLETVQSSKESENADAQEGENYYAYSGSKLLDAVLYRSDELANSCSKSEDSDRVSALCDEIRDKIDSEEEIESNGGLLPEYQKYLDEGEYEDEEDLCNSLGLNYDEIYDDEPKTYGEEYKRGFFDCIDDGVSPYSTPEDDCSEAYYQGLLAAEELRSLIG